MRWKKIIWSGSAALGAAALYNSVAQRNVPPLPRPFEGDDLDASWRGHRITYVRTGEGSAVLLLHSIHPAAWSYEWRHNVAALAETHTVYVPDLLGFGRSDRPDLRYSARLYTAFIADFAEHVIGEPCALVGASLSAAYAIVAGARDPQRFPALVLVEPTGLLHLQRDSRIGRDVARLALATPGAGTAFFNGVVSRRSLRVFLKRAYADDSQVTDELVDLYYTAAHQAGAKHAPSAFVARHLDVDVRHAVRRLAQPTLLIWGEQAVDAPIEEARGFIVSKPDAEVTLLDAAGSLPHDERPAEFNAAVLSFLARRFDSATV